MRKPFGISPSNPLVAFHILAPDPVACPFVDKSSPFVDKSSPFVDKSSPFVDNSSPFVDNSSPVSASSEISS
jgi:hypothetical protein